MGKILFSSKYAQFGAPSLGARFYQRAAARICSDGEAMVAPAAARSFTQRSYT